MSSSISAFLPKSLWRCEMVFFNSMIVRFCSEISSLASIRACFCHPKGSSSSIHWKNPQSSGLYKIKEMKTPSINNNTILLFYLPAFTPVEPPTRIFVCPRFTFLRRQRTETTHIGFITLSLSLIARSATEFHISSQLENNNEHQKRTEIELEKRILGKNVNGSGLGFGLGRIFGKPGPKFEFTLI